MRIYVDSSALIKRVVEEPESQAVEEFLERAVAGGAIVISSALAWVEVTRSLRGHLDDEDPKKIVPLVENALSGVSEHPLSEQVVGLARRIGPPALRSLDAIHLAAATLIDADVVVAFDEHLLSAAIGLGFQVDSPR
jgi:predicted nucleic acid-binding protein